MEQTDTSWLKRHVALCLAHKKIIGSAAAVVLLAPVALIIIATIYINSYKKYVLSASSNQHYSVGIVLGAGITSQGKPFKELEARLNVAADALISGTVDKLILSGDNRFIDYDEPTAMQKYLIDKKHIPANKLQPDYAGRSTYQSCERAAKVFGVKQTIIFSAGSHLPRAIFLCRHFGIEAYGISSNVEANNSTRREILASVKALLNVYVHGDPTVLGPPIKF